MNILSKKSLFWDVQQVDLQKNGRFVIERILQFGNEDDFFWARKFYGSEKIKEEFIKSKVLDNKSSSFWRQYFNVNKAKCAKNQLTKKQAIEFNGLKIADKRDIAAMKLDAISSRGSKKDFIDIYFLLQKYSLKELIGFFESKYSGIQYNKMHILKSLTYFEDADDEPTPIMLKQIDWNNVKDFISNKANEFLR